VFVAERRRTGSLAGISVDHQGAARHGQTGFHPYIAFDRDLPSGEAGPKPDRGGQVPLESNVSARGALDLEKISQ
jgi:hypothetical protein